MEHGVASLLGALKKDSNKSLTNIFKKFEDHLQISWIKIHNYRYQPNCAIQIDRDSYAEPCFGLIKYIILTSTHQIFFIYIKIHVIGINSHFGGYLIKDYGSIINNTIGYKIVNYIDLFCKIPSICHTLGVKGQRAISVFKQET